MSSVPYEALYHLSRALHHQHMDPRRIMQTLLGRTGDMTGLTQGFLVTFTGEDVIHSAYILDSDNQLGGNKATLWENLLDRGLIGFVYHGQRTIVIRNMQTDPRWPELPEISGFPNTGSAIGIPLRRGAHIFGVMMFIHPQVDFFTTQTVDLLEEIAALGSIAINNAWDFDISGKSSIRYQTLFDDAVVPMLLTDLNGSIVSINRKATDMLLYDRHDLLLKPITAINQIDLGKIGGGDLAALEPEEEATFRSVAIAATGDEIPVLLRVRRLSIAEGNLIEWVQQDMTAQMALEQLRRDLTAMVYHDLRGPLQAISGSIQKLAQVLANHENPAVRTLLQIGVRSNRQLRRMIDSLLDVQRLEEGSAILDRDEIEMRVVLADATQLVQPLASEAGQRIRLEIDNDLPLVSIDNDMIVRVIINLMENAVKYTPSGGTITLCASVEDDFLRVSVRDSGPGIPHEYKQHIFDKFNRINYRNAPMGVGLGLAFCRLAVHAHGGQIWVESEEGNGSEFIFTVPLDEFIEDDNTLEELVNTA